MALRSKPFPEQVALVTGGGTGIGRALAGALASAGARVVIASRSEGVLRRTADELNAAAGGERVYTHLREIAVSLQHTAISQTRSPERRVNLNTAAFVRLKAESRPLTASFERSEKECVTSRA